MNRIPGLAAALWLGAVLAAQTPTLTGTWQMLVQHHHGVPVALVLTQDGEKVKGTLTLPHGGDVKLEGAFADGKLTLSTAADAAPGSMKIDLDAKILDDGSLAGNLSSDSMGKMDVTAERLGPPQYRGG